MTLTIYTTATPPYEHFVGLYAFAALYHVEDSVVEIGLDDPGRFASENEGLCQTLSEIFPERFKLSHVPARFSPGTDRFVTVPTLRNEHVYIGDIDIIILERQLLEIHLGHMEKTGLPYSNCVRPNSDPRRPLLSGLHFTTWDAFYPLPNLDDIDLERVKDEHLLYQIVIRKGLQTLPTSEWFRPVHGIHASMNRPPQGGTVRGRNTGAWAPPRWHEPYVAMRESHSFKKMLTELPAGAVTVVQVIDLIVELELVKKAGASLSDV